MALLAAFQALLQRHSGQDDILVGSPIAGRTPARGRAAHRLLRQHAGAARPVCRRPDPGFRGLLDRARATALGAYAHQDLPFERLVEELDLPRDLSHNPLFQVLLVLQNPDAGARALPGLTLSPWHLPGATSKFDLSLSLTEALAEPDGGLRGGLEYATDLFDRATAVRLLEQLRNLIGEALAAPDRPFDELPLLGEAERHQIALEWNDAREDVAAGTVLQLFDAWVARAPAADALVTDRERLSYQDLDRRSRALVARLRAQGVGPETLVALSAERSPELIVSVLGVLRAGGAYLPLDSAYPAERIAFMLEDSGARALPLGGAESVDEGFPPAEPGHLAYVIYTSGSTGRPKGVMVEHGGIPNLALAQRRAFDIRPGDRVLQWASFSFDAAVSEIWMALANGAALVLSGTDSLLPGPGLLERLRELRVTHVTLPPSALAAMTPADPQPVPDLPALRTLVVAGEACPPELARRWARGRRLVNAYGPTEATVCATVAAFDGEERLPIGRPIANVRAHVLERGGAAAPVGVPGELCLGGVGLARGYLGRPDLTAERWVPDPLSSSRGERLYRTGDLARLLPDGRLEFLGRLDNQVKVRGFRIELGEIEAALARLPAVRDARILVREEALVAYVVADGTPDLRSALSTVLPAAMVPSGFIFLDALPLTPNGKVDTRALARIAPAGTETTFAPTRTPTEELLAGIWSGLLGVERIGARDDFFELGGHSLMAARLLSRLRDVFGVELPLRALFEAPVLAGLAARVDARLSGAPELRLPPVAPTGADEGPLSFAQERLWFLDRLEPDSPLYNIPVALRLTGQLDPAVLERSLAEIVRRHGALRTTFGEAAGEGVQSVAESLAFTLPTTDLRGLPEPEREALASRLATEDANRPFDLRRGPLLRARLLRLSETEWVLLLNVHHIVSDGWSMGVLVQESAALYQAFAEGAPSPLPELPVQYLDFALWQRRWLQGAVLEEQLAGWREALAGAPTLLELPADRPRPAVQSYAGAAEPVALPAELAAALGELARGAGATLFMVLLAGFQALLHRYTRQDDVLVGTPVANRGRGEVEGLIGFFVNTLVLRGRPAAGLAFRDLLHQARSASLESFARQDVPFEKVVEALGVERTLAHSPLFQVLLVLQNTPAGPLELPGVTLAPVEVQTGLAKFDLTFSLWEAEGGALAGSLEYATALFDVSTARRLLGNLRVLLDSAAADPSLPLGELALLTPAEREQLRAWNATTVSYFGPEPGAGACLHELIAAQAGRTPDAVAVRFEDESLTYGELDRRAGLLAARLRGLGVGPETLVGICAERSLEMVVGLLGILRSGGAYVPLDPSYPADRLAFMLEDAALPVLLAQNRLLERLPGLPELRGRLLLLDEELPEIAESVVFESGVEPGNAAYAIFTSGSTGRPKGAVNAHRGVVNRLLWGQSTFRLGPGDRVLQKTPFSFDVSVWELFAPLISGACLVMARPDGHQDPAYLVDTIEREGITTVHFVPSMLQVFLEQDGLERCASLRRVIASGEALPPALADRFFARLGGLGIELWNLYGPTEAAVEVTYHLCQPGEARVPIGRPVANVRAHILDAQSREVPAGVAGEPLPRRRAGGPRLPAPPRPDGRPVRPRSVRRRLGSPGRAALPHRRPGAAPAEWAPSGGDRVPRPDRPPGEDPRFPHRARGDRGGAGAPPGGPRGGGAGAGRGRGPLPDRLPGAAAPGARGRAARVPAGRPARVHGAGGLRVPGLSAAPAEWQGGSQGPGADRAGAAGGAVDPAGHPDRGAAGGDLDRPAAGGAGRGAGQLLRAGRSFADGDPAGLAAARGLRSRAAPAGALRGAGAGGSRPPRGGAARHGFAGDPAHRRPGGAAVLLPGASLVPRSHGAGQPALQPSRGAAPHRAARSGGPGASAGGHRRPARRAADHLRRAQGRGGPDRGAGARLPDAAGGPGRPAGGSAAGGGRAAGAGRGRPALRSAPRSAAAGPSAAARGDGLGAAAQPAPHRQRRLVDEHPDPGGRGALLREAPAGVADPVCRLRALAAALAAGGGPGEAARLVAGGPGGRAHAAGAASRPAAPGHPGHRRSVRKRGAAGRAVGGARRLCPGNGRDALYGAARGLPGPAAPLHRAGRHPRRLAGREPQPGGGRGADRLLRQHPGPARPSRVRLLLPAAARPGPIARAGSVRPSGRALRQGGRGGGSGAHAGAQPAVPGPARPAERPARAARASRE